MTPNQGSAAGGDAGAGGSSGVAGQSHVFDWAA
jgi:hypothetical protein